MPNRLNPTENEKTVFVSEGFIEAMYISKLDREDVKVIELRYLTDGVVFHTVRRQMNQ